MRAGAGDGENGGNAPRTDFEIRTADWLDLGEAQSRVVASAVALPPERVPLSEALGQALAEDVAATATLPPWDNSAMDGYAVRGDDITGASPGMPIRLNVVGVIHAGDPPNIPVEAGEAVRIMTGAPIPPGADSVIRVEYTDAEAEPGVVRVLNDRDRHANVRPGGQDARVGDVMLLAGDTIVPGVVGILAALGHDHAFVHRRPRVALVSTGDELRAPDRYDDVRAGAGVPESNGPMLSAAVRAAGGIPVPLGIVADDQDALGAALAEAKDADLLVTIGGASMGEADLVKRVLDSIGYRQDFWRVKVRPGSPFGFGWLQRDGREQPVFGLPGNPASAFVTFELFVRPFLLASAGHKRVHRSRIIATAEDRLVSAGERTRLARVSLHTNARGVGARSTGPQGSGLVGSLRADGLAIVPPGSGPVEEGDPVEVMLLGDGPVWSPSAEPGGSSV